VRSTDETLAYWAKVAGHSGKPHESVVPDTIATDNVTTQQYSFRAAGKPEITLLKVNNGKHEAPPGLDVFAEAWKFCKRQMPTAK
jgi:polyhydroxybutyrate depolymerase